MTKILTSFMGCAIALFAVFAAGSRVHSDPCPSNPEEAIKRLGGFVTPYVDPDASPALDATPEANDPSKPKPPPADTTVTFINSYLTDADLICVSAALEAINPKKLDLRYTKVTGAGVWRHLQLPNLVDLDLSSTLADGIDLVDLVRFPNLANLRLSYNRLRFDCLSEYLAVASAGPPMPRLRLHLAHVRMFEVACLPDAPASVLVEVPADVWLGQLAATLAAHPDFLEGLDVSSNGLSKAGLAPALSTLPGLVRLNLGGNKSLDDEALAFLGEGGRSHVITHLDLSGTRLTSAGLNHLKHYQKLTVLNLAKTRITDVEARNPKKPSEILPGLTLPNLIRKNRNLTKLDLSNTFTCVTHDVLTNIGNLQNLTTLNLAGTGITNDGLKIIWKNQRIAAESLESDPKQPQEQFGSAEWVQTGALVSLDVSRTRVTDKGLVEDSHPPAARFPLLVTIIPTDTKITSGGLQYYQALRANRPIPRIGGQEPYATRLERQERPQ